MKRTLQKKLCIAIVLAVFSMALSGCGQNRKAVQTVEQPAAAPVETGPVRQWKDGLQTILVMVLDRQDPSDTAGAYRNGTRADFMMLIVVEEQPGKVTWLQLNPDTVVPFSVPGKSQTMELPVGQVYSYGSGGSDSCLNIMKATSQLFGGVPVDHYLTFTMDSLGIVSDMLGGVSVAAEEGTSGEDIQLLQGADVQAYFSTRDGQDVANEEHMQRQRQFMMGFYQPFMVRTQQDDFLTKLTLQLGDRMATDLTLSQLMIMFETLAAYELDETIMTVQGDAETVNGEFRFYADEASLYHIVEVLFSK